MRPSEVKGAAKLLLEDYDTPEDAAKAVIGWLDKDRTSRTSYVAVLQFGQGPAFYVGLGPYPGKVSAAKAAESHPAAGEAWRVVVIPTTTPEGVDKIKKEIDVYRRVSKTRGKG